MQSLKYINDAILEVASGSVIRKYTSPLYAIVMLITGLLLMFYGSTITLKSGLAPLSYLILLVGFGLVGFGIFRLIFRKEQYLYSPTGSLLQKQVVYLRADGKQQIMNLHENEKLDEIMNYCTNCNSSLMMDIWKTKDNKVCFWQVSEYKNYQITPITQVKYITSYEL